MYIDCSKNKRIHVLLLIDLIFVTGGIILAGFVIGAALSAVALLRRGKQEQANADNNSPPDASDFQLSMTEEGVSIRLIYGKRRVNGNIIWYGNLDIEEVVEESEGGGSSGGGKGGGPSGGGGGGGEKVTGHDYYVDVWQAIGEGKLTLTDTYIDNKLEAVQASQTIYNDGTNGLFPSVTEIPDATQIPGVAHIFYKRFYMGRDNTTLPTVHFIVERDLSGSPISFANMSNGNNPAAIIYDMLIKSGFSAIQIDISAFQSAATFYNSKGYGLNLVLETKMDVFETIQKQVLNQVGGFVYQNNEGQYTIKPFDPAQASLVTLNDDDFVKFRMTRGTYDQLPNDFTITYKDQDQSFTNRTVQIQEPANIIITGNRINKGIDLKGIRDRLTAEKRANEIMKEFTFPLAEFNITTNLKFSYLQPGDKITLNKTEGKIQVANREVRIMDVDTIKISENKFKFSAIEITETIIDSSFLQTTGTQQQLQDFTLTALSDVKVFELPYNSTTKFEPSFLMMPPRNNLFETGYTVLLSQEATQNYISKGFFKTFALHGTLDVAYGATTKIDDEIGLVFTPDTTPAFENISRANLFQTFRLVNINDELMAFQNIQPDGPSSYKLTGVIRGLSHTPRQNHSISDDVYITYFADNVLLNVQMASFYLKFLPHFRGSVLDASSAPAIAVTMTEKAKQPINPRVRCSRTGSNITIEVYPRSSGVPGAGDGSSSVVAGVPPHPFPFEGDFLISYSAVVDEVLTTTIKNIVEAGSTTVIVKSRRFGFTSSGTSVFVDTPNGIYKA